MSKQILLQNGTVISHGKRTQQDVYIVGQQIVALGNAPAGFVADTVIDATNKFIIPGLIDLSARIKAIGSSNVDVDPDLQAALAGGVTSFVLGPKMSPVLDEPDLVEMLILRTQSDYLPRIYPLGAMTVGLKGEQITEMAALHKAGCFAFSQADGALVASDFLLQAMRYAQTYNFPLWLRPLDATLGNGVMAAGAYASRLGLVGIPDQAETIAIFTLLELQKIMGVRLHFSQVSSAAGLELIRQAKAAGASITCDVSINHVHLIDLDIAYYNSDYRLSPPLRSQHDRQAIRQALLDGTIDAICSNHTPIADDQKLLPFAQSQPGATGFQLLLSLVIKWADEEKIPLEQALELVTSKPLQVLQQNAANVQSQGVEVGAPATLCVIDPNTEWQVNSQNLLGRSTHTPFSGYYLPAQVVHTLINGSIVWSSREIH